MWYTGTSTSAERATSNLKAKELSLVTICRVYCPYLYHGTVEHFGDKHYNVPDLVENFHLLTSDAMSLGKWFFLHCLRHYNRL